MLSQLVRRGVGWRQVRWKAKSVTWGEDMKARKTHRLTLVAEQMSRLQKETDMETLVEMEEASALEMLQTNVPVREAKREPDPTDSDENLPSDLDTLDKDPNNAINHYIVIKKGRERSKYTIIRFDEILMARSKLPRVTSFDPYVQIRDSSGHAIIGYGLWKPSKKLVYVFLWVRAARHKWSPHQQHDPASLTSLSIGRKFWFHRFFKALEYRQTVTNFEATECFNLINSDADGCPGVTVDLYSNAAAITVTDSVATSYLKYLVEYLQTRTPTTVIHISSTSRNIVLPQELSGYIPRTLPSTTRVVLENEMLLRVALDNKRLLVSPAKRGFREVVEKYAGDRKVVVLGDESGSCVLYALKGGCKKVLTCNDVVEAVTISRENIKRNFSSEDTTEKTVTSTKGVAHHFPDLEKRVASIEKKVLSFATDVGGDVFDCVVVDMQGNVNPQYAQHQWVEMVLTKLVSKTTITKKQGGMLIFISNFDLNETQNMLRNAAEHTNLDIRLVEPIFPSAHSVKNILTNTRQAFSGWVVNIRTF
eukprot:TRINITY_DN26077_c0_g1_i2.p1 TRINITY_DN26077_c0_g1~~TRINITY_DN26077_c0_g1_i2.p1  ORF type:complete len:535 (+),score=153.59 TRINITY_DN26077_c0_g1_i2:890-2494(+)